MTTGNTHNYATHFPRRTNMSVRNMKFAADIDTNGHMRMELGIPATSSATGIINAQSIATALVKSSAGLVAAGHRNNMGTYGRNVIVILSGAGTPAIEVFGLDYLGQPMSEQFIGAGAVSVVGKKAFKEVTSVSAAATAVTMSVGYGVILGLPYATSQLTFEQIDGIKATAGTFVTALQTAQTATSADPRGTYSPNSAPNGVREYVVLGIAVEGDYHGLAHYTS